MARVLRAVRLLAGALGARGAVCIADTGRPCIHLGCNSSLGPAFCNSLSCVCRPGHCFRDGVCAGDPEVPPGCDVDKSEKSCALVAPCRGPGEACTSDVFGACACAKGFCKNPKGVCTNRTADESSTGNLAPNGTASVTATSSAEAQKTWNAECSADTGGSCLILGCIPDRGPTICSADHRCLCKPGYCNNGGVCFRDPNVPEGCDVDKSEKSCGGGILCGGPGEVCRSNVSGSCACRGGFCKNSEGVCTRALANKSSANSTANSSAISSIQRAREDVMRIMLSAVRGLVSPPAPDLCPRTAPRVIARDALRGAARRPSVGAETVRRCLRACAHSARSGCLFDAAGLRFQCPPRALGVGWRCRVFPPAPASRPLPARACACTTETAPDRL